MTSTLMTGLPSLLATWKGKFLISRWTSLSSNLRPISRLEKKKKKGQQQLNAVVQNCTAYLTSKIVLFGFEEYWFFAASPTRRSSSVKATYEGVIRFPWSFTRISTLPFCITPTQEYVVPKSIPITIRREKHRQQPRPKDRERII